jgi:hypothetical protein
LLDGNALGVDSAQIRIVEEVDEEGLGGFLEGHDGLALPSAGAVFFTDCLGDFADLYTSVLHDARDPNVVGPYESLERELPEEQVGRLLVALDLAESDGTGLVALLRAVWGGSWFSNCRRSVIARFPLRFAQTYVACQTPFGFLCWLFLLATDAPCCALQGSWAAFRLEFRGVSQKI